MRGARCFSYSGGVFEKAEVGSSGSDALVNGEENVGFASLKWKAECERRYFRLSLEGYCIVVFGGSSRFSIYSLEEKKGLGSLCQAC
jgi:hypothetical protein